MLTVPCQQQPGKGQQLGHSLITRAVKSAASAAVEALVNMQMA